MRSIAVPLLLDARVLTHDAEVHAGIHRVGILREAYARALSWAEERTIAAEGVSLARSAIAAAEDRYRSGAASRIEVNTARVELGRAARAGLEAARAHAEALARLRVLLGFHAATPPALEGDLRSTAPRPRLDREQLITRARQRRPHVAAAGLEIASAAAARGLAGRQAFPRPRVGGPTCVKSAPISCRGLCHWTLRFSAEPSQRRRRECSSAGSAA